MKSACAGFVSSYLERSNYPYLFAIVWLVIKAGVKYTSFYAYSLEIGIGLNLLFLPLIIFFAMKPKLLERKHSSMIVAKDGMKSGAKYALSIAIAVFIYYQFLDPAFGENKLIESTILNKDYIESQGGFAELQKSDPTLKNLTEEEYLAKQREFGEIIYQPFTQSTASILALVILSILYSLIVAVLFKVLLQ